MWIRWIQIRIRNTALQGSIWASTPPFERPRLHFEHLPGNAPEFCLFLMRIRIQHKFNLNANPDPASKKMQIQIWIRNSASTMPHLNSERDEVHQAWNWTPEARASQPRVRSPGVRTGGPGGARRRCSHHPATITSDQFFFFTLHGAGQGGRMDCASNICKFQRKWLVLKPSLS